MDRYSTEHSLRRAYERLGMKETRAEKMMKRALKRGKTSADFSSAWEREYLERKETAGARVLFYNGAIYVFSGERDVCITVYPAPHWMGRKRHYINAEILRHPQRLYAYGFADGRGWSYYPGQV